MSKAIEANINWRGLNARNPYFIYKKVSELERLTEKMAVQIDELRSKIDALESENDELRDRIRELE